MIPSEAIAIINNDLEWAKQDRYPYISKSKIEALNMAIKALKALSDIRAEIESVRADDYYKYVGDFQWGVDTVRAIIDKHTGGDSR